MKLFDQVGQSHFSFFFNKEQELKQKKEKINVKSSNLLSFK